MLGLTEEQSTLMSEMLESDKQIKHDRNQIDSISKIDRLYVVNFTIEVFENSEYSQLITITQKVKEVEYYHIYTKGLFIGMSESDLNDNLNQLNAREQLEITDKLQELKNTIQ